MSAAMAAMETREGRRAEAARLMAKEAEAKARYLQAMRASEAARQAAIRRGEPVPPAGHDAAWEAWIDAEEAARLFEQRRGNYLLQQAQEVLARGVPLADVLREAGDEAGYIAVGALTHEIDVPPAGWYIVPFEDRVAELAESRVRCHRCDSAAVERVGTPQGMQGVCPLHLSEYLKNEEAARRLLSTEERANFVHLRALYGVPMEDPLSLVRGEDDSMVALFAPWAGVQKAVAQ